MKLSSTGIISSHQTEQARQIFLGRIQSPAHALPPHALPQSQKYPSREFSELKMQSFAINNRAKLPFAAKISQENTICAS